MPGRRNRRLDNFAFTGCAGGQTVPEGSTPAFGPASVGAAAPLAAFVAFSGRFALAAFAAFFAFRAAGAVAGGAVGTGAAPTTLAVVGVISAGGVVAPVAVASAPLGISV